MRGFFWGRALFVIGDTRKKRMDKTVGKQSRKECKMDDFDTIFFVIMAILIFFAVKAIKAEKRTNQKNAENTALLNLYSQSDELIRQKGIVISKNYTYCLEPNVPFARVVIDDVHKSVFVFSSANKNWLKFPLSILRWCEIRQTTDSSNLIRGAVHGAIIAGGAGAVVGAMAGKEAVNVNGVTIVFVLDDINTPEFSLPILLNGKGDYQQAISFANSVKNALEYVQRHGGLK